MTSFSIWFEKLGDVASALIYLLIYNLVFSLILILYNTFPLALDSIFTIQH